MTKVLIGVILALFLALGLTGYVAKSRHATAVELQAQTEALRKAHNRALERAKRDRRALVAREAEIASQGRKFSEAQQGLSRALQAEKAWADTEVPPDVQKALSGPPGPAPDRL